MSTPPIETQLEELAADSYGSYGIYLNILETGEQAGYEEDKTFYAASCYKLFLVMYIYESAARGAIDLERAITYQEGDVAGEEGVIQNMPLGTSLTTRKLCRYVIACSDNVAARMLRRTYGYHPYRDYAASIGCPVSGRYGGNLTTAREMGILLLRVLQFADTNPLGLEVISFLEDSTLTSRIPAGLPDGVIVGNKTGDYQGYVNDVAVVFLKDLTYILCILSQGAPGGTTHVEASRLVYEDINRRYNGGDSRVTGSNQPSTQWFFMDTRTEERFETWLCLSNNEEQEALTVLKAMGEPAEFRISVPAKSMVSLRLNQLIGTGKDVALNVTSQTPITAERVTYCRHRDAWSPAESEARLSGQARELYFAGISTQEGVETCLYLVNPASVDTSCTIVAMTSTYQILRVSLVVPAQGRQSLALNDLLGSHPDIALCIFSNMPILAEKVVYPKAG